MKNGLLAFAAILLLAASPSDECLHCHDGSSAIAVRGAGSHPVRIVYPGPNPSKYHLRPIASVPAGVLIDGRVECTSCHVSHEVESGVPYRLTKPIIKLCQSCHDL